MALTKLDILALRQMMREVIQEVLDEKDENAELTFEEVVEMVKLPVGTVRQMNIPHIKRGKRNIYKKAKVREYIDRMDSGFSASS